MRRGSFFNTFFVLLLLSALLIKTPTFLVVGLRGQLSSILSPFWNLGEKISHSVTAPINQISNLSHLKVTTENLEKNNSILMLENALLKEELLKLSSIELEKLSHNFPFTNFALTDNDQLINRVKARAVIGKVIYRNPASWSSSIWINLGETHNKKGQPPVIAVNSPVTSGGALIGIIDYVGKQQSRVRLITDSGMTIPVRASRGKNSSALLIERLKELQFLATSKLADSLNKEEQDQLLSVSDSLISKLSEATESTYLAKGEVRGKSLPLWRSYQQSLEGTGFNYEFSDDQGNSVSLDKAIMAPENAIISDGDLLVTSGLDGFLPSGLSVAIVSRVHLLKEGAYYFELDAIPAAGDINEVTTVSILPPVSPIEAEDKAL
ncbi:MAG: hypothetical protein L7U87_06370 [Chlamydiales bacterium]|nr:hypothetical protein [Chlamydiales bacterium]